MEFSLFFFSGDGGTTQADKYKLFIETAKFADRSSFSAIWTPERHFHPFGGLYPNPSLTSAAIAMVTERIQLRAGSVVVPLHSPVRIAEEWSVVDNLSNGRVALAFASGWTVDDFVLSQESYANRKENMWRGIRIVQKLWEGEAVEFEDVNGRTFDVKIFPRPQQPKLPIWITCQSEGTFARAGKMGANVLTSLLTGTLEELANQIALYRESLARHGHDPQAGKVALMLHTFLGKDIDVVREQVKEPFFNYLKTHIDLLDNLAKKLGTKVDLKTSSEEDINTLLLFAYESYLKGRTLIGTPGTCMQMLDSLKQTGVDEIACLIDFGMDFDSVMESLHRLKELKEHCNAKTEDIVLLS